MIQSISNCGIVLLAVAVAIGCGGSVDLGARDAATDSGPRAPARTDQCGNGVDDDGNGRIDDGCPCGPGETQSCFSGDVATRGVGMCSDGTQTCTATGSTEWGDWGNSPCVGDTTPREEMCDGRDHDCDGARDEGCPCTAGESRACGVPELVTGPCMGGTQTCASDGTWGSCEGAVGPSPDVCGDGIDNDCNGTVDDTCDCIPTAEICRDGIDNDCDGIVDEPACMPDWPPADGGVPTDGGPVDGGPAEGCTDYPDFRDRITWETVVPGAGHFINWIGGSGQAAWLGGPLHHTVTVDLRALYDERPFTFGSFSSSDPSLGRLSFVDGSPLTLTSRPTTAVELDVTGAHVSLGGRFKGTVDYGAGSWTSDPATYTSAPLGVPVTVEDVYWALGSESTGAFTVGDHYSVSGVPTHGMAGSFEPWSNIALTSVDSAGNTYIGGTLEGVWMMGALTADSTAARPVTPGWARFVASFDPTGASRWLRSWHNEQQAEGTVDETGRFLVTTGYIPSAGGHRPVLELLDAAAGTTLFRHVGSSGSFALVARDVDADGNVYVTGKTKVAAFTLGALTLPPERVFVASFDRGGALRWSHVLLDSTFPAVLGTKHLITVGASEVALLVGLSIQAAPIEVDIAGCRRAIEKRWYPRSPETGVATSTRPSTSWEVDELLIAVLDSRSGSLRWLRRADSITRNVSLEIHPSGDLLFVMHNEPSLAKVSYSEGLMANATHVFRLRGR